MGLFGDNEHASTCEPHCLAFFVVVGLSGLSTCLLAALSWSTVKGTYLSWSTPKDTLDSLGSEAKDQRRLPEQPVNEDSESDCAYQIS